MAGDGYSIIRATRSSVPFLSLLPIQSVIRSLSIHTHTQTHTLHPQPTTMVSAIAVLKGEGKVSGKAIFTQENENSPVTVTGEITGNDPNVSRASRASSVW